MGIQRFAVGASVMLSELGRRNSRSPGKHGRIVGISRTGTAYRVRWMDLKTADYVHATFLQEFDELARPGVSGVARWAQPDQLPARIASSGASKVQTRPAGA